ncbi:hypothetical protein JHW43_000634 [Diplocarpon mali]|nr:hypothetical protein JHW43_000634 [Diplocarpon mali]
MTRADQESGTGAFADGNVSQTGLALLSTRAYLGLVLVLCLTLYLLLVRGLVLEDHPPLRRPAIRELNEAEQSRAEQSRAGQSSPVQTRSPRVKPPPPARQAHARAVVIARVSASVSVPGFALRGKTIQASSRLRARDPALLVGAGVDALCAWGWLGGEGSLGSGGLAGSEAGLNEAQESDGGVVSATVVVRCEAALSSRGCSPPRGCASSIAQSIVGPRFAVPLRPVKGSIGASRNKKEKDQSNFDAPKRANTSPPGPEMRRTSCIHSHHPSACLDIAALRAERRPGHA